MRVKLKPIDEGACDDIAEPFMKPRYDEDKDISRHAAVGKENCHNMERRYGWKLLDIEELPITAQSITNSHRFCTIPQSEGITVFMGVNLR
ncbi:hypothetical protein [Oscillatoria sp. FACHB-1406]|uniref:hypothetical protein n=1 Tax=Oscillatoria sp. FACHB-1406 TaxID=2692846 RepID=UPI0016847539|nr:hypothetical protein [Oscillatoria sp. FACHB-1406]